jgi:hypothetical protein
MDTASKIDMATVCYYTFSTVCQTLAGAFGFLVAVVLYRMKEIPDQIQDKTLLAMAEHGRDFAGKPSFRGAILLRKWSDAAKILKNVDLADNCSLPQESREFYNQQRDRVVFLLEQLDFVGRGLRTALILTGSVIFLSLLLLLMSPCIARYVAFTWICLIGDWLAAGVCLILYFRLAKGVVEEGPGHDAGRDRVVSGSAASPYSSGETPVSDAIETFDPDTGEWTVRAEGQRARDLIEPLTWERRDRHTVEFKAVLDERGEILKLRPAAAELEGLEEGHRVVRARLRPE